jgi:TatD DNase family protein
VPRILTVGTTVEGSRDALALAERHPEVFAIVGIHPHEAGRTDGVAELRDLLGHERAVAVGETGLDFYRDWAPRDRQQALFECQLELAAELGKPVVIHSRAADRETLETLAGFAGDVVLHCFSSPPMLRDALERGYYISFAGNVTYKNASELRLAATQVSADRLLTETDSPYLAPQPLRGRPNEPANLVHTLEALAAARRESREELENRIEANAQRVFGLP